jgi:hypothetical protein
MFRYLANLCGGLSRNSIEDCPEEFFQGLVLHCRTFTNRSVVCHPCVLHRPTVDQVEHSVKKLNQKILQTPCADAQLPFFLNIKNQFPEKSQNQKSRANEPRLLECLPNENSPRRGED